MTNHHFHPFASSSQFHFQGLRIVRWHSGGISDFLYIYSLNGGLNGKNHGKLGIFDAQLFHLPPASRAFGRCHGPEDLGATARTS